MKTFKQFLESKMPHVNDIGNQISDRFNLIRGKTTAMNQSKDNCYEIAVSLAKRFGYEMPSKQFITDLSLVFKNYYWRKSQNPNYPPPKLPPPSEANAVVWDGPGMVGFANQLHITFEYRNREYNYGSASDQQFKILFKYPLRKLTQNAE